MRSGIPWIALWLGVLAGGAVSPVAVRAQQAPPAQPAPQGTAEPAPRTADDQTNNVAVVSVTPPAPAPRRAPLAQPTPVPSRCQDCGPTPWWLAWVTPWSLGGGALLLLLLLAVVGTTIMRRRRRARWLERLTVTAGPGAEASMATSPIALAGPVLTVSIRFEPGKAGPLGPMQILGVTYDD